jgi:hypothetical protein
MGRREEGRKEGGGGEGGTDGPFWDIWEGVLRIL